MRSFVYQQRGGFVGFGGGASHTGGGFWRDDVEKAGGIWPCWGREEVWPELL